MIFHDDTLNPAVLLQYFFYSLKGKKYTFAEIPFSYFPTILHNNIMHTV